MEECWDVMNNKLAEIKAEIECKTEGLKAENKRLAELLREALVESNQNRTDIKRLEERDHDVKEVLVRVLNKLEHDEFTEEVEVPPVRPKSILKTPELHEHVNVAENLPGKNVVPNSFADECKLGQSTPMYDLNHSGFNQDMGAETFDRSGCSAMNNSMRMDVQPVTFDGSGMSLDDYLCHFSSIRVCNEWNDQIAGAHFAACMRGNALSLLNELSKHNRYNYHKNFRCCKRLILTRETMT